MEQRVAPQAAVLLEDGDAVQDEPLGAPEFAQQMEPSPGPHPPPAALDRGGKIGLGQHKADDLISCIFLFFQELDQSGIGDGQDAIADRLCLGLGCRHIALDFDE